MENKPNKLIFLDIDGVLNHTYQDYVPRYLTETFQGEGREDIDPRAVALINMLCELTGAKIVISSTWRILETIESLQMKLERNGFTQQIYGFTPRFTYPWSCRGNEIKAFIDEHYNYEEVKELKYVIFDDDTDMLLWQQDNFVNTDHYVGLTPTDVYRAKKILGVELSEIDARERWDDFNETFIRPGYNALWASMREKFPETNET